MTKVSAIIVINENHPHLFETLRSIDDFVTEIIIGTMDIPSELTTKLRQNPKIKLIPVKSVPYADLIKEDLKKSAKGDFILYMDPDEIFPEEIAPFLTEKMDSYDFFYFPRKNIIFKQWISHSRWWPDYQLRLFRKNSVIWPKTIHPIPTTHGDGLHLELEEKSAIIHYNYDNISHYLSKAQRYAASEAEEHIKENKRISISSTIQKGLSEFISRYFAHEGWKDGMHGFVLAFFQMFYYFLVYFYYWEKQGYEKHDEKKLVSEGRTFFKQGLYETNYWMAKQKLASTKEIISYKISNTLDKLSE